MNEKYDISMVFGWFGQYQQNSRKKEVEVKELNVKFVQVSGLKIQLSTLNIS